MVHSIPDLATLKPELLETTVELYLSICPCIYQPLLSSPYRHLRSFHLSIWHLFLFSSPYRPPALRRFASRETVIVPARLYVYHIYGLPVGR